jgi:hypothetical protein
MKNKFKSHPAFHNWCVSDKEACRLIVPKEDLEEIFQNAVDKGQCESFYRNTWNKALTNEIAQAAKEEYMCTGLALSPFHQRRRYAVDSLTAGRDQASCWGQD